MGGRVDMTMSSLPSCIGYMKAKRLKALAVTTAKRMPFVPDIPTMAESGLAGYDVDQWYCVLGPVGAPRAAVQRVHEALAQLLQHPDAAMSERFATLGSVPLVSDSAEFTRFIHANLALWHKVVKLSGARVD